MSNCPVCGFPEEMHAGMKHNEIGEGGIELIPIGVPVIMHSVTASRFVEEI